MIIIQVVTERPLCFSVDHCPANAWVAAAASSCLYVKIVHGLKPFLEQMVVLDHLSWEFKWLQLSSSFIAFIKFPGRSPEAIHSPPLLLDRFPEPLTSLPFLLLFQNHHHLSLKQAKTGCKSGHALQNKTNIFWYFFISILVLSSLLSGCIKAQEGTANVAFKDFSPVFWSPSNWLVLSKFSAEFV